MENSTPSKKSRKPVIVAAIVFILMAGAGVFYWISSMAYETTDDAQLDGNIYSVRAGVTAYLGQICFKDNQWVKQGDTLFVFDTVALKAKVEQAKAALENAKTKLSVSDIQALASMQNADASVQNTLSGKEGITAAKARLDRAQSDFDRDEELQKIQAVTQIQFDADKATLTQAQADYAQAIHQQQSLVINSAGLQSSAKAAHHQISAAAALVAQCEAELTLAQEQLTHAFITAPCTGIVSKRAVDLGQYVLTGQSLCAVVDVDHLWVTANFKETQIEHIQSGQPVKIEVDAFPDIDLTGVVQSFGGATGDKFALIPPDNATGNFIKVTQRFPIRIKIKNYPPSKTVAENREPKSLFPGLSVFVKVKIN